MHGIKGEDMKRLFLAKCGGGEGKSYEKAEKTQVRNHQRTFLAGTNKCLARH
jgi:hypothetical protein